MSDDSRVNHEVVSALVLILLAVLVVLVVIGAIVVFWGAIIGGVSAVVYVVFKLIVGMVL